MRKIIPSLIVGAAFAGEASAQKTGHYASLNGLKMYYEIHGAARGKNPPLVLLHGGGSTIMSTFGRLLPDLAKTGQVIAVELQAHGGPGISTAL